MKTYFDYEAVQFLTLLIKLRYPIEAQGSFIAVNCSNVLNCDEFQVTLFHALTMLVDASPGDTIFLGKQIVLHVFQAIW